VIVGTFESAHAESIFRLNSLGVIDLPMSFRSLLKPLALASPFVRFYAPLVSGRSPRSQGDEAEILLRLSRQFKTPRNFVEFGFHPLEYNCWKLSEDGFDGLLIDGDSSTIRLARYLLPKNVQAECRFLTVENLDLIANFRPAIGVLSIDVDGMDYWLTKTLLPVRPAIVCVEYNASLGLRPITVPYKAEFDRHVEHRTGWYHGASLSAFYSLLCGEYDLHAVSSTGSNAIFVRRDLGASGSLPHELYRESSLRNSWSGLGAEQQWESICNLQYVTVGCERLGVERNVFSERLMGGEPG